MAMITDRAIKQYIVGGALDLRTLPYIGPDGRLTYPFEGKSAKIITFDGANGTGKSTTIKALEEKLRAENIPVTVLRETDHDPFKSSRQYYQDNPKTFGVSRNDEKVLAHLHAATRLHVIGQISSGALRQHFESGLVLYDHSFIAGLAVGLYHFDARAREITNSEEMEKYLNGKKVNLLGLIRSLAGSYFLPDAALIFVCDSEEAKARVINRLSGIGRVVEPQILEQLPGLNADYDYLCPKIPNSHCIISTKKSQEEIINDAYNAIKHLI